MIYYCTPFSLERNLGKAYNEYVRKLTSNPNDWIFFIDRDCTILDADYGNRIEQLINKYPETGIFTAVTNRCGNNQQCYLGNRRNDENILHHYQISEFVKENNHLKVTEINRVISGYFFGFSLETWQKVGGFTENANEILKVDNRFSKRVLNLGKKILLMDEIYVFHFYRLNELDPKHSIQHLT
jgi:GT2 family glycosyltransferase